MTTISAPVARRRSYDLLGLLRLDAALCAATGVLAVAAAPAVADVLGPDVTTTAVRVVGVALLVWAADVALVARASGRLLRRGTVAVAVAGVNLAWALATVVLVLAGAFSGVGAGLALAVAAVVGGLGLLQLRALRA